MADSKDQLQANTYIWSQSDDQVTISFLVPETCKTKDLEVRFEHQHVCAGLKGQEPVLKGKLFSPINHFESLWQLERTSMSPLSSMTTSPSLSIASSYALMSSPNHSPNSSMILPAPALAESANTNDPASLSADMADIYQQAAALGSTSVQSSTSSVNGDEGLSSQVDSPVMVSSQQQQQPAPKYRILTIHLEKEREGVEWAVPVSNGWKSELDIDITSAYHLGEWFETRMLDYKNALRYYQSAAERGHTPSMIKVAGICELDQKDLPKDPKTAFTWYKRAADAVVESAGTSISNGPDPLACYIVGSTYGAGSPEAEVEKNYEQALIYFNRAMNITAQRIDIDFTVLEQDTEIPKSLLRNHGPHYGNEHYFCSAAFQTGLIYLYGSSPEGEAVQSITDVANDPLKALRYWKEASILGHAQASYNIGIMYANGMGVEQDLWEAGRWFGRAVKLDNTGKLQVPDGVKAVDWDAKKEDQQEKQQQQPTARGKKMRRRRRKAKRSNSGDDGLVGVILALGSAAAVAGVIWWYYSRESTRN
ncbi:HCP-like protein [Lichtheimia hyalospora FSU 10163]|nr:HCP-like protein [Lichtheimia hyalospora FSU 10163]